MFIPLIQQILKENSFLPMVHLVVDQLREGPPTHTKDQSGKRRDKQEANIMEDTHRSHTNKRKGSGKNTVRERRLKVIDA